MTYEERLEKFKEYSALAEKGDAEAQCNLAYCYELGDTVKRDMVKAFYWYARSAEQGYTEAEYNLGKRYVAGFGVKENPDVRYDKGVRLKTVPEKAAYWFKKAADKGHIKATYELGMCYFMNYGVKGNKSKAKELLMIAKNAGDIDAAVTLLTYRAYFNIKGEI